MHWEQQAYKPHAEQFSQEAGEQMTKQVEVQHPQGAGSWSTMQAAQAKMVGCCICEMVQ